MALVVSRAEFDGIIDPDAQIERFCAAERAAVYDLAEQPAFRAALIRTAEDQHRLVLTVHHIVLDGWSLPILLGEIFASFGGHRLPAPLPYRAFVTWLADRDLDAARAAWRVALAGFDVPRWSVHRNGPGWVLGAWNRSRSRPRPRRRSPSWPAHRRPPSASCCRPPGHSCWVGDRSP